MTKKGIIYYTDNRLKEPIFSTVQEQLLNANLPIISVSLSPINLGYNIVFDGVPGYVSMVSQILTGLKASTAEYIFFCEHDVLYHPSHFDFTPKRDDIFYYNLNNWRWDYPNDRLIRYDGLTSLSQLCASRKLLIDYYELLLKKIIERGVEKLNIKDPYQARVWGYEPGRKKMRNGSLIDISYEDWSSEFPNIDIRHSQTFSLPKVKIKDFYRKPTNWKEISIDKVEGWDLKKILK